MVPSYKANPPGRTFSAENYDDVDDPGCEGGGYKGGQ